MTISKVRGGAYGLPQERDAYDLPHPTLPPADQLHKKQHLSRTFETFIISNIFSEHLKHRFLHISCWPFTKEKICFNMMQVNMDILYKHKCIPGRLFFFNLRTLNDDDFVTNVIYGTFFSQYLLLTTYYTRSNKTILETNLTKW